MKAGAAEDGVSYGLVFLICFLAVTSVGLFTTTLYWRQLTALLRQENSQLRESLAKAREVEGTQNELHDANHDLQEAHQFDSYRIQQLEAASRKLEQFSNALVEYINSHLELGRRLQALESENSKLKADYEGKPRVPRVGAWLGVRLAPPAAKEGPAQAGAVVKDITDNSPADRSLLQVGDIIVGIDGERVSSPDDFRNMMGTKLGGQKVTFDVLRAESPLKIEVEPTDWPQ